MPEAIRAETSKHMHWDLVQLCKCQAELLLYIAILYHKMTSFAL
jgi:hypothetical protein